MLPTTFSLPVVIALATPSKCQELIKLQYRQKNPLINSMHDYRKLYLKKGFNSLDVGTHGIGSPLLLHERH